MADATGPAVPIDARVRALRALECLALFVGAPLAVATALPPRWIMPLLLAWTAGCAIALLGSRSFDRRALWNARALRPEAARILLLALLSALVVGAGVLLAAPERFLSFPRQRPEIWALVMVFYPVFSVYPQELVFRAFFFHRYRAVFPGRWAMIAASALAFGWAHVVFHNAIAVALCLVGGAIFSWTYSRTRSVAAVWLEHALYGCLVFTLGLGQFFYAGAIRPS